MVVFCCIFRGPILCLEYAAFRADTRTIRPAYVLVHQSAFANALPVFILMEERIVAELLSAIALARRLVRETVQIAVVRQRLSARSTIFAASATANSKSRPVMIGL